MTWNWWTQRSLHVQLALISAVLLAITIGIGASLNIRQQQRALLEDLQSRSLALCENLALTGSYLVITNKLAALEELLLKTARFPNVQLLRVLDTRGHPLGSVLHSPDADPYPIYDTEPMPLPADLLQRDTPLLLDGADSLRIWYPLRTSSPLGWLLLDVDLSELQQLRNSVLRDNLLGAAVAIGLDILSLLLILWYPARGFRRAVAFASRLTEQPGQQLDEQGGSREISSLIRALNASSSRLKDQQQRLARRSDALGLLNATLEQRVEQRTEQLRHNNEQLRLFMQAVSQSPAGIVITRAADNRVQYVNPGFSAITGLTPAQVEGRPASFIDVQANTPELAATIDAELQAGNIWQGELVLAQDKGRGLWSAATVSPVRDDLQQNSHHLWILDDISERKHYEEQLLRQASYDELTGLPNRRLSLDRLRQALAHGLRRQRKTAVMYLDVDRFKVINDTLGHRLGDLLLMEVADRLKTCLRNEDTPGRLGGDEFLIIASDIETHMAIDGLAEKVRRTLEKPVVIEGREMHISCSIGISVAPDDSDEPDILLRNADAAMYQAKQNGRSRHQYFTQTMNQQAMHNLLVETELHKALARHELMLHYQPIVNLQTGRIEAAEALLRWQSSELGMVEPEHFIPIAEICGLIAPVGEWVLNQACANAARWPGDCAVAVNVSGIQLRDVDFVDQVTQALHRHQLPASRLHLEITEGTLLAEVSSVSLAIQKLSEMGISLSIDDFGTGYSSLSYLKRFPCPLLKIDKSFVRHMTEQPDDAALVTAVVQMAGALSRQVIAEGVETEAQRDALRALGCQFAQGYLFSPPVSAGQFVQLLWQDGKAQGSA